jgi:hypothetical protein
VYEQAVVRSSDHRSVERLHTAAALRNLLAVSQSAKSVALESKTSPHSYCLHISEIKYLTWLKVLFHILSYIKRCFLSFSVCWRKKWNKNDFDFYSEIFSFLVGFVETTIEHIKQLHSKMNIEALQLGKTTAKKKEDPLVQDLVITFDVLRNLLYMNEDAKVSCCSDYIPLHPLQSWQRSFKPSVLLRNCIFKII